MKEIRPIVALALRIIAVAMATASVALITFKVATIELHVILLAFGLFTPTRTPLTGHGSEVR